MKVLLSHCHRALEAAAALCLTAPLVAPVPLSADDSLSELLLLSTPLALFALPLLPFVLWLLLRSLASPATLDRTAEPPLPLRDDLVRVGLICILGTGCEASLGRAWLLGAPPDKRVAGELLTLVGLVCCAALGLFEPVPFWLLPVARGVEFLSKSLLLVLLRLALSPYPSRLIIRPSTPTHSAASSKSASLIGSLLA